jgi:NitT/TauT family transport system substrate-binding protein
MSKRKIAASASILIIVAVAGYWWQAGFWSWKVGGPVEPVEKITISTLSNNLSSVLLVITQEKGYFRDNGLEVTLKFFPTGVLSLGQLEAGQSDIAHMGDFVLVGAIFKGAQFLRCLGSIGATDIFKVMARKDKGILQPGDLKNKKVGVARGTASEFFLGRFLTFHNLHLSEVQISNLNPVDMVAALTNDQVDAVMAWEPITYEMKKRLADKIISWDGAPGQKFYNPLVSTEEFVKVRPRALERLFHALAQGETFIKHNQDESLAIIAKWLDLDPFIFKPDWLRSDFELSLDQGLLISMEDQARWMISNKLTDQTRLPDFLDYFSVEPLAKVDPKAVRMIIPQDERPVVPAGAKTGPEPR